MENSPALGEKKIFFLLIKTNSTQTEKMKEELEIEVQNHRHKAQARYGATPSRRVWERVEARESVEQQKKRERERVVKKRMIE